MNKRYKSKIWLISDEIFIEYYNNSINISDFLKKFDMINKGGNAQTLKNRMNILNLDINKLIHNGKIQSSFRRRPDDEVFCENSSYPRKDLKRRIIRNNLLNKKCEQCDIIDTWNNKKLVLILDHINGISNDNRLENLRFLCPNCNSQQDTFSGRNIPKRKS